MAKSLYRAEHLELAVLLRQAREDAGMVQAVLAERLDRNQSYVSNVELGIRRLDLVELRDYCAGLGLNLKNVVERWEDRVGHSKPKTKVGSGRKRTGSPAR